MEVVQNYELPTLSRQSFYYRKIKNGNKLNSVLVFVLTFEKENRIILYIEQQGE